MTDNEIIKALELCCTQDGTIPCYDCPCWDYDEQKCEGIDHFLLHTLIKRQQAEIKNTQELLQATIKNSIAREENFKYIRAEAIKGFAERLEKVAQKGFWDEDAYVGVMEIESIMEEMIGEMNE